MPILRIRDALYFGDCFTAESLNEVRVGDDNYSHKFDWELLKTIFLLESCDEAIEVFEDMYVCPFCHAIEKDGVLIHKSKKEAAQ